jgi:protease IV
MRGAFVALLLVPLVAGCKSDRFVLKTKVETQLDLPPVSTTAGHVKPVVVQGGAPRIAIIDVDGLLMNTPFVGPLSAGENPMALFREKLEAAACDPCIRAVVLRVNSPGGGVAACNQMRRDLDKFKERTKLPVVACLQEAACGGAYLIASGADQVVAGPATVTGGLGVLLNLFNLRDTMQLVNVIPQGVKAGKFTDIGTSSRALTEEEKALLQAMATEMQEALVTDVKRSRPAATDATCFDGRIFTGKQAQGKGLIDTVGDLDDALALAAQLGGCANGARPGAVMYRRKNDPARSIYAVTANVPLQGAGLLPSLPGLERARMPTFLSLWQPELALEKLTGK